MVDPKKQVIANSLFGSVSNNPIPPPKFKGPSTKPQQQV